MINSFIIHSLLKRYLTPLSAEFYLAAFFVAVFIILSYFHRNEFKLSRPPIDRMREFQILPTSTTLPTVPTVPAARTVSTPTNTVVKTQVKTPEKTLVAKQYFSANTTEKNLSTENPNKEQFEKHQLVISTSEFLRRNSRITEDRKKLEKRNRSYGPGTSCGLDPIELKPYLAIDDPNKVQTDITVKIKKKYEKYVMDSATSTLQKILNEYLNKRSETEIQKQEQKTAVDDSNEKEELLETIGERNE